MGEDPSPGLAESGLLIIVPCTYQHIRCRLRRRACGAAGLAGVNGDVAKEGFRTPEDDLAARSGWPRSVSACITYVPFSLPNSSLDCGQPVANSACAIVPFSGSEHRLEE